jgi:hypothetical protein
MNKILVSALFLVVGSLIVEVALAQSTRVSSALKLARLKYSGGGDWYNDQSAEVNLLKFVRDNTSIAVEPTYEFVDVNSEQLFTYPMIFLTGHGNIVFNENEVKRLRTYLESGGFLYADDDYGMDKAFRREMKKIFPGQELVELPFTHGIYHTQFEFPNGPSKTHEHDKKSPQGFGLFHNGRLVVYYTVESNPSDGWADADVHNDTADKRSEALRFGANIIVWALTN